MGFWTRANPEMCLLGSRGQPKRRNTDVAKLLLAPRREHSRKPEEAYAADRAAGRRPLSRAVRARRAGRAGTGSATRRQLFDAGPVRTRRRPSRGAAPGRQINLGSDIARPSSPPGMQPADDPRFTCDRDALRSGLSSVSTGRRSTWRESVIRASDAASACSSRISARRPARVCGPEFDPGPRHPPGAAQRRPRPSPPRAHPVQPSAARAAARAVGGLRRRAAEPAARQRTSCSSATASASPAPFVVVREHRRCGRRTGRPACR